MKRYIFASILIAVVCLFIAVKLWPARREAVFYPMGGIPFRVIEYDRNDFEFDSDVDEVEVLVSRLEDVFSSHRAGTEVSRINKEAHGKFFEMSPDMRRVIGSARKWWEKTDGAFDITVGPLIRIWNEAGKTGILPDRTKIDKAVQTIGMDKIQIEDNKVKFRADVKDAEIGLGGIAKGDIVDQAADLLHNRGVKRGVVDAGGDIIGFGSGTFSFGIQDPTAKAREKIIGVIEMPAGAIVTSGNYERHARIGDKKYSHIIDPKTGLPADNGLISVTVLGERCMDADALATALMVLGREKSIGLLRSDPQYKGILVENNGDKYIVWVQSGLIPMVHFEEPWGNWVRAF